MSFGDINTSGVTASQFGQVSQAIQNGRAGIYPINDRMGFQTVEQANSLGRITLGLQGTLMIFNDSVRSFSFRGTLRAFDDVYDANPSNRDTAAELKTTVLRAIPGVPYDIQIRGCKDAYQSGRAR